MTGVVEPETFLQRVHCSHLLLAEAETFNSQVGRHPLEIFRLRYYRVTPLHAPAQHHLAQVVSGVGEEPGLE